MLPHGRIGPLFPLEGKLLACVFIISFQGCVFYTLKGFFYYGYQIPQWIRIGH